MGSQRLKNIIAEQRRTIEEVSHAVHEFEKIEFDDLDPSAQLAIGNFTTLLIQILGE